MGMQQVGTESRVNPKWLLFVQLVKLSSIYNQGNSNPYKAVRLDDFLTTIITQTELKLLWAYAWDEKWQNGCNMWRFANLYTCQMMLLILWSFPCSCVRLYETNYPYLWRWESIHQCYNTVCAQPQTLWQPPMDHKCKGKFLAVWCQCTGTCFGLFSDTTWHDLLHLQLLKLPRAWWVAELARGHSNHVQSSKSWPCPVRQSGDAKLN